MSMPVDEKLFENYEFGKAALKKIGDVSDDFRLYEAGFIEDKPSEFNIMKIVGAEFRAAKTGKNKGKLTIIVPGTKRVVYVTKKEIKAIKDYK